MVNIQIGLDGVPSLRKVAIGNKYENQDEMISFELPIEFDNFNKYVISVMKINGQKYTSNFASNKQSIYRIYSINTVCG